ncbi:Gfo/Idh/MocA family protein [Streptomyces sp. DT224]|uniref:Gfo/Idh/MocA family protein n=1 Tax=Streptomyces sp. DT224 TaxID=3393426 RepID=UPI003CE6FEA1
MRRVLLIGCGEVGAKHADALTRADGLDLVAVADPSPVAKPPSGVPLVAGWEMALKEYAPDVVVVATPPGSALVAARAAARTGAVVLVEKPATLTPADLRPAEEEDRRIYVAFQPHFAPGLAWLLSQTPTARRAAVRLVCRRDRGYYRDWRTRYATAGGILHQQAIHGLALALRLLPPGPVRSSTAEVRRVRQWGESEDRVTATVLFESGAVLTVEARVDSDEPRSHDVTLHLDGGQELHVRGRNLEIGLGRPHSAPDDRALRLAMYRALPDDAGPLHPCLFPLSELRRTLEVIDHAYRTARTVPEGRTAS